MFVLHVILRIKAGESPAVEQAFLGPFKAAISAQEGFLAVALLRPEAGGDTVLSIAFENQQLQQKWAASDLHQQVWPMIDAHLAGYTLRSFMAV